MSIYKVFTSNTLQINNLKQHLKNKKRGVFSPLLILLRKIYQSLTLAHDKNTNFV